MKIRGKKTSFNQIFSNGYSHELIGEFQYFYFYKDFFHTYKWLKSVVIIDLSLSYNFDTQAKVNDCKEAVLSSLIFMNLIFDNLDQIF